MRKIRLSYLGDLVREPWLDSLFHPAIDCLEVPGTVTRYCMCVGVIEHDDGPVVIRCCDLGRLMKDGRTSAAACRSAALMQEATAWVRVRKLP